MTKLKRAAVVISVAASIIAAGGSAAFADDGANGVAAHSPGVISGNVIQIPLHVPINLCGNSIDIVGLLNGASGNTCINKS